MATTLDNKNPLGKLILRKLYLMGKNQTWLAKQMGVEKSFISIICTKTKNPSFITVNKISKILDIELQELANAVEENLKQQKN